MQTNFAVQKFLDRLRQGQVELEHNFSQLVAVSCVIIPRAAVFVVTRDSAFIVRVEVAVGMVKNVHHSLFISQFPLQESDVASNFEDPDGCLLSLCDYKFEELRVDVFKFLFRIHGCVS